LLLRPNWDSQDATAKHRNYAYYAPQRIRGH
jgi:hypothetical protein